MTRHHPHQRCGTNSSAACGSVSRVTFHHARRGEGVPRECMPHGMCTLLGLVAGTEWNVMEGEVGQRAGLVTHSCSCPQNRATQVSSPSVADPT